MATFGSRSEALLSAAASTSSQQQRQPLRVYHYLILISLNSIGAFSSDCYVPNLSDIAARLECDRPTSQSHHPVELDHARAGDARRRLPLRHLRPQNHHRPHAARLNVSAAGQQGRDRRLGGCSSRGACRTSASRSRSSRRRSSATRLTTSRCRMKVQAYFTTMRPLMLLGGPSIGGVIGTAVGWRKLMYGLSVWVCSRYSSCTSSQSRMRPRGEAAPLHRPRTLPSIRSSTRRLQETRPSLQRSAAAALVVVADGRLVGSIARSFGAWHSTPTSSA